MILPTDVELVQHAAATYDPAATPDFQDVDHAVKVFMTTRADGLNIIAIEGTHDAIGWGFDFLAASVSDQQGMDKQTLGFVHSGFYAAGLTALTRCALIAAGGPYAICGHSLGAALALLIGGILSQDTFEGRSLAPVKIGAFAPPRVGGAQFVKVIETIPLCAYRYSEDPVTEVPFSVPGWPYEQVPLTQLPGPAISPADFPARVRCHNIENYVAGVRAAAAA
jgi:hypothetical protein